MSMETSLLLGNDCLRGVSHERTLPGVEGRARMEDASLPAGTGSVIGKVARKGKLGTLPAVTAPKRVPSWHRGLIERKLALGDLITRAEMLRCKLPNYESPGYTRSQEADQR